MIKRVFIALSVAVPAGLLLVFWLFPELDRTWQAPLLHFYLVTFFTFAALVAALFTAVTLGQEGVPRHRLLATSFVVMGAVFLVHGITTPGAIIFVFNPGIRWAAWLTLFTGGLVFALAAFDTPDRPLQLGNLRLIHWALALFCGGFILIVAFWPEWLSAIDDQASPFHQQLVYGTTLIFWAWSAVGLGRTWRQTRSRVDGVMALTAVWLSIATVSQHGFSTWQVSWWLYHGLMLLGAVTAVILLALEYEKLRRFRLTNYYLAIGMIFTAALALLASYLFSRSVEQALTAELSAVSSLQEMPDLVSSVVKARLNGLLLGGASVGTLFLLMLFVVRRADGLITARGEELARAYDDLRAAEAMRDDLTDMIVHDLRAPLTALGLSLDLLEKSLEDPAESARRSRFLSRAKNSVGRMLALVSQLLDVARLESGRLELRREQIDVGGLIAEKAALYAPQAEADAKEIRVEVAENLPLALADGELVRRVLDNLIGNAMKYTLPSGRIVLKTGSQNQQILVQVSDDGEGISFEAAPHIFDKFYQVKDDTGKPLRRGTGVGLAFCKLVVEAHHGRIWVESQPGRGSTFSFTLPQS